MSFTDNPGVKYWDQATALVEDGYDFQALLWIIKNKGGSQIWKKQICDKINLIKNDEGSPFYENWVDWDTFVRKKIEEGVLLEKHLSATEDGGGKPKAIIIVDKKVMQSLLKAFRPRCKMTHDFHEETKEHGGDLDTCWMG